MTTTTHATQRQADQEPAAVRRHYAEQLREQARAAYRGLDYPGALDLIARAAELDPGRPAVWENARTVILTAVTGGRPVAEPERPQARVVKTGRYSQTVECGCGSRFEAPKETAAAECLGCETTARLRAAGIGPGDRGLAQVTEHNSRLGIGPPAAGVVPAAGNTTSTERQTDMSMRDTIRDKAACSLTSLTSQNRNLLRAGVRLAAVCDTPAPSSARPRPGGPAKMAGRKLPTGRRLPLNVKKARI